MKWFSGVLKQWVATSMEGGGSQDMSRGVEVRTKSKKKPVNVVVFILKIIHKSFFVFF